ncbi:RNA 2',3'-cyclic phosphodiesterase [Paenibacillus sp. R14(2021)]|uniref:RNA 2',3'-cyclic phosphodiesterase n=1 Tax=Paenibacillus sp. R14(2021) TaxID=2859228 RepID=UPI001C6163B0|nr:RNA 2',3'-cyclic phosphodiesterase [Paenibacillus sp. R14(2021)]
MRTPKTESTEAAQRLFIAVPLPDALKQTVAAWTAGLRPSFPFRKWTHEADLHVTLQFLGDTAPGRIPELIAALTAAAESGGVQPFKLSLQGTGTFGRPQQPRVFWTDLGGETTQLHRLQRLVAQATAPLGFAAEARPYSPHLTIARSYLGEEAFVLPALLQGGRFNSQPAGIPAPDPSGKSMPQQAEGREDKPPSWHVDEFVLYRTHMHRQPMYEAAARFALRSR